MFTARYELSLYITQIRFVCYFCHTLNRSLYVDQFQWTSAVYIFSDITPAKRVLFLFWQTDGRTFDEASSRLSQMPARLKIVPKEEVVILIGLIWLGIRSSGWLLWVWGWSFGLQTALGIAWLTERRLMCEERVCALEGYRAVPMYNVPHIHYRLSCGTKVQCATYPL